MDIMNKTFIENAFAAMQKVAKELDVILLTKEETFFDDNHLDCVWYGGEIGGFVYKNFKLVFEMNGDVELEGVVKGRSFYYRNSQNTGAMSFIASDTLRTAFKSDMELYSALEADENGTDIEFKDNSWIEARVFTSIGEYVGNMVIDWTDNVLEACSSIKDMINWLEKELIK